MEIILKVFKQTFYYKGKTNREEALVYWAVYGLFYMIAISADMCFHTKYNAISLTYGLILLPPTLALAVRRLHDIGKSGWWAALPLVGFPLAILYICGWKNDNLMVAFVIIEALLSIVMFTLYLQPSKIEDL